MHTGSVSHNGEMSSVPLDIQRAGRTNRHRVISRTSLSQNKIQLNPCFTSYRDTLTV
ncbi:predicted protein [Botrytis cinerea T4]|uniref:Uncharacterized protein n=1 Tax=Botryotinia fuckeliana (strain T4) TaxID=999810 RepID=G2YR59_BOTF4|nr:predicted protein [Botrytis cinerea T4]